MASEQVIEQTVPFRETSSRRYLRSLRRHLPVLVAAFIASLFFSQGRTDEGFNYYDYAWHGQWITSPYKNSSTAYYRKTLFITGPVRYAYLAISADNFFRLKVNGADVKPMFRPSSYRTWVALQTIYTSMGYPRRTNSARIYEISASMRQGRNVISIQVQSDQKDPRLAIQGEIQASTRHEFYGDASWKCSSVQDAQGVVTWDSVNYRDNSWLSALPTNQNIRIPVDGDITTLKAPIRGSFIGAQTTRMDNTLRLRRVWNLPGSAVEGWLRVSSQSAYYLFLNGNLVGNTGMIDRYNRPVLTKRGNMDAFGRTQYTDLAVQYPTVKPGGRIDIYLLKHVLHPGENTVEVVLQPREMSQVLFNPSLFLDAQVRCEDGTLQEFQTDGQWQVQIGSQDQPWSMATVLSTPTETLHSFSSPRIRGKVDSGARSSLRILRNSLLALVLLLAVSYGVAWLIRKKDKSSTLPLEARVASLNLVSALILIFAYLLRQLFNASVQDSWLSDQWVGWMVLAIAGVSWILNAVIAYWQAGSVGRPVSHKDVKKIEWPLSARMGVHLHRYGYTIALAAIMGIAVVLYTRGLNVDAYLADEYVSMLAARGIQRHGIPIYENTGIIYTRSSLFHYLLALTMWLGGGPDHPMGTRFLAGLWQLATIPLVYLFGREVLDRRTGLLAAALLAFAPLMIFYAREVRFYTQFSFFTTLTFYLLLKSVRNPDNENYRIGTILAFCGAFLSQQFAIAMIPVMVLVPFFSRRLKDWLRPKSVMALGFGLLVIFLDLYAYAKYCKTPLPYVDSESVLLLSFHTDILEVLPSMLLANYERAQGIIGILYLGGLLVVGIRLFQKPASDSSEGRTEWTWWNYLYLVSFITILMNTVLTPRPTSRYLVHMGPTVILISACVIMHIAYYLHIRVRQLRASPSSVRLAVGVYGCVATLICLAAYRPARTWNSLKRNINRDNTSAARYVREHQQPGDKVMFFSPEIAMVELGQCDFMWRPRLGSIFKYMAKDGKIRERNSNALVIDNADKLRRIMTDNPRIWLVMQTSGLLVRHGNAASQMTNMLGSNWDLVYEPFNGAVFLWDASKNSYRDTVRTNGFDQFNF